MDLHIGTTPHGWRLLITTVEAKRLASGLRMTRGEAAGRRLGLAGRNGHRQVSDAIGQALTTPGSIPVEEIEALRGHRGPVQVHPLFRDALTWFGLDLGATTLLGIGQTSAVFTLERDGETWDFDASILEGSPSVLSIVLTGRVFGLCIGGSRKNPILTLSNPLPESLIPSLKGRDVEALCVHPLLSDHGLTIGEDTGGFWSHALQLEGWEETVPVGHLCPAPTGARRAAPHN